MPQKPECCIIGVCLECEKKGSFNVQINSRWRIPNEKMAEAIKRKFADGTLLPSHTYCHECGDKWLESIKNRPHK